jgi:hypothetical protein
MIDPTDRSNSPAIINKPTPSAMMLKSGVSLAKAVRFSLERKRCSGERNVKINRKTTRAVNTVEIL